MKKYQIEYYLPRFPNRMIIGHSVVQSHAECEKELVEQMYKCTADRLWTCTGYANAEIIRVE